MAVSESFLDAVTAIVGPAGRITEPDRMQPFLVEERGLFRGRSPMVVRPASTAEVAAVVRLCAAHRVPVVPHGRQHRALSAAAFRSKATPRSSSACRGSTASAPSIP